MNRQLRAVSLLSLWVILVCSLGEAQETVVDLTGSVTLRSGEVLTGSIATVEFGFSPGSGVGASETDYGYLCLKVGDDQVEIPARDMAAIDADWKLQGEGAKGEWVLSAIAVTKKDGTQVIGQPTWLLRWSLADVYLDEPGENRVVSGPARPAAEGGDNLVTRVVLHMEEPPAGVAGVIEKLTHRNRGLREMAARALGQMGDKAVGAVPALADAIDDPASTTTRLQIGPSLARVARR